MRRRNPPSANRRRSSGPPPWPSDADVAFFRRALIARRGLGPDAPASELRALLRAGAWRGGVDMTCAPTEAVVAQVWAWGLATDQPAGAEPARPSAA